MKPRYKELEKLDEYGCSECGNLKQSTLEDFPDLKLLENKGLINSFEAGILSELKRMRLIK